MDERLSGKEISFIGRVFKLFKGLQWCIIKGNQYISNGGGSNFVFAIVETYGCMQNILMQEKCNKVHTAH